MTETKNTPAEGQNNDGFSIADVWTIVVLNWHWIVVSTLIALSVAFVYLRYTSRVYTHSMSILIKNEDKKPVSRAGNIALENMGVISNSAGFDNEVEILSSSTINRRVVKALHLYTSYRAKGRVKKVELYNKNTPIIVDMPEEQLDELQIPIFTEITKNGENYEVTVSYRPKGQRKLTEVTHTLDKLPSKLITPYGTLIVQSAPNEFEDGDVIYATVMPVTMATNIYRKKLTVKPSSKTTTVANITMDDTQSQRAIDYLNQLFKSYNEDANEDKNEVALKTEEFIKERINSIRAVLDSTEFDLEHYKRNNEIFDLTTSASTAINSSSEYQKKQVEIQTQLNLLDALSDYLRNPDNAMEVIPVNLGLSDAGLNASIKEYNEIVMQRKRLLKSSSESNPTVQRATSYIEELGPSIKQSIEELRRNIRIQKESTDRQYNKFYGRINSSPTQERTLTNISRKQTIQSSLYLMLLQKQEENYISLASTATKARIIDDPQFVAQIKPRALIVWLIALVLGISLPIGIIYLMGLLRFNIEGRNDIERLTDASILADIPTCHNMGDRALVVRENTNDMMEEAFRGLRTNLRFILDSDEKVILATSCVPGEGKTFVSSNLAMSLALMGKHVIIVGLDIRKPRLAKLFGLGKSKSGISSFLTSSDTTFEALDQEITHGIVNKNLDVLPAGIIPPNPSELVARERLDIAINLLKEHYDYIILDTPPIGLVSDTLSIGRTADMTLFVCRADYSPKANFKLINSLIDEDKLPKINLVLNGVDLKRRKYGYYYGYGKYGYGKYGKYGYGKYGYGKYGHYGLYGTYGNENGKEHTES
ncbi:MAG: polysaccharide biosynthesis tyrosine autokinase [Bacteroidaceae bacterium]|nr:polysaccharide biosynthesis tyrosine autokinase [Bacteroidaceae bacterium]